MPRKKKSDTDTNSNSNTNVTTKTTIKKKADRYRQNILSSYVGIGSILKLKFNVFASSASF